MKIILSLSVIACFMIFVRVQAKEPLVSPLVRPWEQTYQPTIYAPSLTHLRYNPRVKAFLDTIAYAEGTFHKDGYKTMYGDILFDSLHDHPRQVVCSWYKGKLLCSSAAGRYQILQRTWDRVAPTINAQTFSPLNQDRVAIELIADCEALEDIAAGKFDKAIIKVNKVWASLPGAGYGQRTLPLHELRQVFNKQVHFYTQGAGRVYA